ncbi:hypothetical protein [Pseudomonas sp.]|uniref:hypothetical protein n=1 Tax=Pseudomonas sp. TaxID=306 RepID=UPI003C36F431
MLINISNPSPVSSTQTAAAPVDSTTAQNTSGATGLTVNMKADPNGAGGVGGGEAAPAKQESETVKQLKKQIEQLQQLLQQQQQALQKAQASTQDPDAKAVAVAAAQSQIANTSAALQTVTSALLKAVTDEGNSGTGSMVSTTA